MTDFSILEPHVFYGAIAGAVISLVLLISSPGARLWLAIVFAIFVGIAVDVAAHGYQH